MKILKLKILKLVAGSIQWILPAFLFSDRVLIYTMAKDGVLNRFVDIVVYILRLLYLEDYIYLVYIDTFRTQIIIPTKLLCFIDIINTY